MSDTKNNQSLLRVLILSSRYMHKMHQFVERLNQDNSNSYFCDYATYDDLEFEIFNEQIEIINHGSGHVIGDYSMVYFKTYFVCEEQAAAVAEYLLHKKVAFVDTEVAHYHAKTKLTQYMKLSINGVSVPPSIFMSAARLKHSFDSLVKRLGLPFILKDIASEKGTNNHLIQSKEEFDTLMGDKNSSDLEFIAQSFVPNDGDFRVLVFGGEVYLTIGRKPSASSHLNNTSQGGMSVISELPSEELKQIAVNSAKIMKREVAGVDLMQDTRTHKWYVLEVNNSPQIISGSYLEHKYRAFGEFVKSFVGQ